MQDLRDKNHVRDDAPQLTSYLAPIFADTCGASTHLAVAVSGGSDSMALALLAQHWCRQNHCLLTTLTVDHGLRAESAQEAQHVAAWMHAHGINHATLTPETLPIPNLQARARAMRYGALTAHCRANGITHLLIAHHAEDQAETVLLQQHRGHSAASRAGMALVRAHDVVQLVRPLLGVRRHTLRQYLRQRGQAWIDDPSNASDAYARNRLRQRMTEAEIERIWQESQQHGRMRHNEDIARQQWLGSYATHDDAGITLPYGTWSALSAETRSDRLSHALRLVGGKDYRVRYHESRRLVEAILSASSGKATLGHCLVQWNGERIAITPEHPLATQKESPHIAGGPPAKPLGNAPFWWFAYAPFDGDARASE